MSLERITRRCKTRRTARHRHTHVAAGSMHRLAGEMKKSAAARQNTLTSKGWDMAGIRTKGQRCVYQRPPGSVSHSATLESLIRSLVVRLPSTVCKFVARMYSLVFLNLAMPSFLFVGGSKAAGYYVIAHYHHYLHSKSALSAASCQQ